MFTPITLPTYLTTVLLLLLLLATISPSLAQTTEQRQLDGIWLYVEDRTEGRAVEKQGPPMSAKFELRVEEDAVIYPRPRGDERITLDGSVIEKKEDNGSVARYRGEWKNNWLEYTLERGPSADADADYILKRVFRPTEEGLLVYVFSNKTQKHVALYRHPEDIALPKPARHTINDMAWLTGAWVGSGGPASMEERWSPPKGGTLLGVGRTVKEDKMVSFEFLRIVERDGGLVYIAQPGGRAATEFVLTELDKQRAVFLNPRHDYPQRIVYELTEDGTLSASIGFAKGGSLRGAEYQRENR